MPLWVIREVHLEEFFNFIFCFVDGVFVYRL